MDRETGSLHIFFEEPFWVGIFERTVDGKLSVCKVTFGPEPKDYEVCDFIMQRYEKLRFSPAVEHVTENSEHRNPKRLQREIKRQMQGMGVGTKAMQALKLQQEQGKCERKIRSRRQREEEKELQFARRQQKRKDKHRGR